ncbi:hypothetical protein KCP75_06645 [Salmonella enterica subsp. enterica]|nr:hypothetical protein KCP75_06645 [Salmonella enterica subsp. enterica]
MSPDQMTPAQYDSTTLTVGAGEFRLKAAWAYFALTTAGRVMRRCVRRR